MRKLLLAFLLCSSFVSAEETQSISQEDENLFHFDVCFISETHRDWNFRSGEVKEALENGKRVCSISVPQSPDHTLSQYVRNRVITYINKINPDVIYLPRVHEEYVKRFGKGELSDRFIYVEPPDKEMSKLLTKILRDFQMDTAKVWILYDHSMNEDKRIWVKNLKAFKVQVVNVKTKNSLRKYLRKINKTQERGVIINLMSSVEDAEYSRYMTYEEIKHELQTQNRMHLTVGVEETRIYNEALVFDYDDVDSKVGAFVNKSEFDRIHSKDLYLGSSWQNLGGFLGGRGTN